VEKQTKGGRRSRGSIPSRKITPFTDEEHGGFLRQALHASEVLPGETDKEHSGRVITALLRIDPTDELEYMIATQLVGLHNLAIQTMGHAAGSTKVASTESAVDSVSKLSRAWVALHDTLAKHRVQQTTTTHEHDNDGGRQYGNRMSR